MLTCQVFIVLCCVEVAFVISRVSFDKRYNVPKIGQNTKKERNLVVHGCMIYPSFFPYSLIYTI